MKDLPESQENPTTELDQGSSSLIESENSQNQEEATSGLVELIEKHQDHEITGSLEDIPGITPSLDFLNNMEQVNESKDEYLRLTVTNESVDQ